MIKDIENGKINCVITKDLSRLGREMYKTGKYIEEYKNSSLLYRGSSNQRVLRKGSDF